MMVLYFIGLYAPWGFQEVQSYINTPTTESYPDFLYKPVIKQAQEEEESPSMAVRRPFVPGAIP